MVYNPEIPVYVTSHFKLGFSYQIFKKDVFKIQDLIPNFKVGLQYITVDNGFYHLNK